MKTYMVPVYVRAETNVEAEDTVLGLIVTALPEIVVKGDLRVGCSQPKDPDHPRRNRRRQDIAPPVLTGTSTPSVLDLPPGRRPTFTRDADGTFGRTDP